MNYETTIKTHKIKFKGFHRLIEETSPRFIKTFNESYRAEQEGLNEIASMGYRKAVEILIGDFFKKYLPEEFKKQKENSEKNNHSTFLNKFYEMKLYTLYDSIKKEDLIFYIADEDMTNEINLSDIFISQDKVDKESIDKYKKNNVIRNVFMKYLNQGSHYFSEDITPSNAREMVEIIAGIVFTQICKYKQKK